MRAGELDRIIVLRRATVTKDALNTPVKTWSDLATVRGSKRDVSDGEKLAIAAPGAQISTRFQIRWAAAWADLGPKDQLVCDGRTYNIVGVKELQRRRGLEISANAQA
jgi:head-tail adaptor